MSKLSCKFNGQFRNALKGEKKYLFVTSTDAESLRIKKEDIDFVRNVRQNKSLKQWCAACTECAEFNRLPSTFKGLQGKSRVVQGLRDVFEDWFRVARIQE